MVNAIYQRAKRSVHQTPYSNSHCTGEAHRASDLERKFLGPFAERLFGGIPDVEYVVDLRKKMLCPANVEVSEFFFKAGSFLNHRGQQENYISTNYTHVVRDLIISGVNVVSQMLSKQERNGKVSYSLSCNPDTSLDISRALRALEAKGKKIAIVGEVNRNLPLW